MPFANRSGGPRFSVLSSAILTMVVATSRFLTVAVLRRDEGEFWFEILAAFTAVAIHIVIDKNLTRIERQLRRRRP
jgi:hypothetical protein